MEVPTRSGKNIEDEIPSFESNRELMPFSRVIGARKKRSVRRHHGQRGEIEVVSASFAVPFHVLNHLGSRLRALPVNAVSARHHNTAKHSGNRKNLCQQLSLREIICVVQESRPDVEYEPFALGQTVHRCEQIQRLLAGKSLRVLWKRLCRDS